MVAVMAEPKKSGKAKVAIGVRVDPDLKTELEQIADEMSRERFPAQVTAGELAAVAVAEYVERYKAAKVRAKERAKGN